jgi:polysaccharide pyruvyl transferase WcaK-like protein
VTLPDLDNEAGSWSASRRGSSSRAASRVGVFGLLGSGNLGNDASFEVVLGYLRAHHPDAVVDAMCMGPERLKARYGIDAIPLQSYRERAAKASRGKALVLKVFGKGIDAVRTAAWTRRHDVVIVPGMGVLETSLPLRATGTPYALFLLSASGRLLGTKVALVSVGATMISQRPTRWLFNSAARLASYRSYRDAPSLEAMRRRGVYTAADRVYPDLVFALPVGDDGPGDAGTVGVGVMAYYGSNDDRKVAEDIYVRYIRAMKGFTRWLVDTGHRVRLFWGDDVDTVAVDEILADLRAYRPDLEPACVVAEPCASLRELMAAMAQVGSVVGIRYHNVLSALKLAKPTISIGYSTKHDALMEDMGMSDFSLRAQSLDPDHLIGCFTELKRRSPELRGALRERNLERACDLEEQFVLLSSLLFPSDESSEKTHMKVAS